MDEVDRQRRVARRAFIQAHHPDRGGNESDFVTGLAELDDAAPEQAARVTGVRRTSWTSVIRSSAGVLRRRNRVSRVR